MNSVPLTRAMVCAELECSTVFDGLGRRSCPACGGHHYYPVGRFLREQDARVYETDTLNELTQLHRA